MSKRKKARSQLILELSEGDSIATGAAKLIGIVCLLLWVSSAAAAYGSSRPNQGSIPPVALQTASSEAKQTEIRELKQGQVIERELAGGESHTYWVVLAAGRYLKVAVEQKGVDVVVRLFEPDGKKLTEVDSPTGTRGLEVITVIAEVAGEYRLELKSSDEKAMPGWYEVKIEQLRESTAKDRESVAAEKVFAEAEQLRAQGTAESLRKAVEQYKGALQLWRSAEDRPGEATALFNIGVIYWQLGESRKSLEYYTQALEIWRAVANRREEARTLHSMGVSYSQLSENQKALEYYSQALPLRRTTGDRQGEAITLNSIGFAHDNLGRLQEALDYYNQALTLQRALGSLRDAATTLSNIGATYFGMGDLPKALEYYSQALPLRRTTGDRRGEAVTLNNIGVLYWQLGENEKALEYHNQALPLRRATGDRVGEFSTLQNFGIVHLSLGEPQKALEYHNQALSLARALGDRRGEAITLQNVGTVYRWLNEPQKALEYSNQALLLRRAVADRRGEANTLSRIGTIYSLIGEPEKALSYLEQALTLQRAVGDQGNEAATLQEVARVERDRGRLNEARAQIETALNLIESARLKFINQQLRTSFMASRQSFYEFYIDLLMRMHRNQPSSGYDAIALQASERARARSLLEMLSESRIDIRQGGDLVLLERERTLQQHLSAKAERLTRLLNGKPTEEQAGAARREVEMLLEEFQDVETQLRAKSPRYAALTQPQPLSPKAIQQQVLDEDTLLLEYALSEERSYLWAVTTTAITAYELPKRAELEKLARRVYDSLTARNRQVNFETAAERRTRIASADAEYNATAEELSKLILAPAAAQMNKKRLLIVSDGALQYLPFAALPIPVASSRRQSSTPSVPLIASYEVVSLPSASTLAVLRKELAGRQPAPKALAVLADPVFGKDDERLKTSGSIAGSGAAVPAKSTAKTADLGESPLTRSARDLGIESKELYLPRLFFTRREAEAIVRFAPEGQFKKAIDFAASKATATDPELSQYRYVHFATHTLLNSSNPGLSGIVLSLVNSEGDEQEGFLLAQEIYNLKLPAELVVLSSCKTGLGKEVRGEGVVGITLGFMYAGAARVTMSLWDVDDEATAEMMKRFYRAMLTKPRLSPAAALHSAQVSMWRSQSWRAPYYWAAFVLQGEYK
jgi:CHAT domain-containing protein/Tfp pilus assembly protein PilF